MHVFNRSFSNPENEQKEQDASIERLDRELDQTRDNLQKINDRRKIYIFFILHSKKDPIIRFDRPHRPIWSIIKNDN